MNGKTPRETLAGREKPSQSPLCADWEEQDAYLNEALQETIPASDPISPGRVNHRKDEKAEK